MTTFSIFLASLVLTFWCFYVRANLIPAKRLEEIAKKVNSMQTTWQAAVIQDPDFEGINVAHLLGELPPEGKYKGNSGDTTTEENDKDGDDNGENKVTSIPSSFDVRGQFPECGSIASVYDQGNCGSAWAITSAATFSDRICIRSEGKIDSSRSSQQLLSCTYEIEEVEEKRDGCQGGRSTDALEYIIKHGVVTGGGYDSEEGCQPYLHPPCAHYINTTGLTICVNVETDESKPCEHECYNKKYQSAYEKDAIKAKSANKVDRSSAMNEIYNNGPIIATFDMYEDFYAYKSGVYQYTTGNLLGYHDVQVIGWGEEEETQTPYWIVVNSWGKDWGENGTFRIHRTKNNCGFGNFIAVNP